MDLIYILMMLVFALVMIGMIAGCARLEKRQ